MINLACKKKIAIGIALMSFVGAANALASVDTRTFNAGALDAPWTSGQINVSGAFDHIFNFTAGSSSARNSIVGMNFSDAISAQYRFGLSGLGFEQLAWETESPVPINDNGLFSYSYILDNLNPSQAYSFEIKGRAADALYSVTLAPVPEPESFAMLLAGLGLMGTLVRRKKISATGE